MHAKKHNVSPDEARPLKTSPKTRFSVAQLLIFQLRIGLSILIVVPFVREIVEHQDRILPSTYVLVAITFIIPVVAIIFLVNAKTLLSTISLILITLAGAAIGFLASFLYFPGSMPSDHNLLSAATAILFWFGLIWYRKIKSAAKADNSAE